MSEPPPNSSPVIEEAWRTYQEGLEEVRGMLFGHPFAQGPRERDEAHYFFLQLQAEAFRVAVAPRPDYPRFYPMFESLAFTWGVPTPDFIYTRLYLDGRRTYRIRGRRSNSAFVAIQAINAHFTLPFDRLKHLGDFDLDSDFRVEPDGGFEIILSATRHEGNWIPLDPDSDRNFIVFREVLSDWETQTASEMDIETIDDAPPQPMVPDDVAMGLRLEGAVRFMKAIVGVVALKTVGDALSLAEGPNRFGVPKIGAAAVAAVAATYNILVYELAADEALIVELDPPNPKFWDIQVSDIWNQAVDYAFHQATLNMGQAAADADGKVRVVLSHRDPGVANWLDPVESVRGTLLVRWYHAQGAATPQARLVKFADLAEALPRETARVTPQERAAALAARRRAIARRRNP
jgi:hypothetical protein